MKLKRIKAIISISLVGVIILTISACSQNEKNDISLYDLNSALCGVADFKDMKYASSNDDNEEELFANISDMSYSKVQDFFINYASNGTGNADEIACIQVKSKSDVKEAVASLNAHLQKRISLYDTYDKSQSEKLSKAVVTSYGNVAILIVGDKVSEMEKAFYNYLEG